MRWYLSHRKHISFQLWTACLVNKKFIICFQDLDMLFQIAWFCPTFGSTFSSSLLHVSNIFLWSFKPVREMDLSINYGTTMCAWMDYFYLYFYEEKKKRKKGKAPFYRRLGLTGKLHPQFPRCSSFIVLAYLIRPDPTSKLSLFQSAGWCFSTGFVNSYLACVLYPATSCNARYHFSILGKFVFAAIDWTDYCVLASKS